MAASAHDAALALTRLGLGARPGDIARVAPDPSGWLAAQIRPQGAPQPPGDFPDAAQRLDQLQDYRAAAPRAAMRPDAAAR